MEIPQNKLTLVSEIKSDSTNPNVMSEEKFEALKKNIETYGFLIPVITNKEGIIADGYHRYEAAKALGMEKIPVIALDVDEVDRRILRQVLNKLKGEHDFEKDIAEYQFLMEHDKIDALESLLVPDDDIRSLLESVEEAQQLEGQDIDKTVLNQITKEELEAMGKEIEGYAQGSIRRIVLYFDNENYIKTMEKVQVLLDDLDLKNPSELFLALLEHYHKTNEGNKTNKK